jgi:hypothetical protein
VWRERLGSDHPGSRRIRGADVNLFQILERPISSAPLLLEKDLDGMPQRVDAFLAANSIQRTAGYSASSRDNDAGGIKNDRDENRSQLPRFHRSSASGVCSAGQVGHQSGRLSPYCPSAPSHTDRSVPTQHTVVQTTLPKSVSDIAYSTSPPTTDLRSEFLCNLLKDVGPGSELLLLEEPHGRMPG